MQHELPLFAASPVTPQQESMQKAVQQGFDNADPGFADAAFEAICAVALRQPFLSLNDVWPVLEAQGITTHDNRATGGVMVKAKKRGFIAKTNETTISTRKTRNCGDLRVWKSLVYVEVDA